MADEFLQGSAESKRYDVPWIDGDVYKTENSSIANGVSDRQVTLTGIVKFTWVEIINDNTISGNNLIVKINDTSNDEILVYPGEVKTIRNFKMESMYLSNSSGATVNYRVSAYGTAT
jgi:hypothetical protein